MPRYSGTVIKQSGCQEPYDSNQGTLLWGDVNKKGGTASHKRMIRVMFLPSEERISSSQKSLSCLSALVTLVGSCLKNTNAKVGPSHLSEVIAPSSHGSA